MSFSTNSGGGAGPMSEINVTPLVDVMLVLLIIFMVTAPMVQAGLRVDLPNAEAPGDPQRRRPSSASPSATKTPPSPRRPSPSGSGSDKTTLERLTEQLRANAIVQRDHEAYLQADESIPYGIVVRVLAAMRTAGVERLGIVTDPLSSQ